ncbi:MAG: alkaline phosphatase [Balneolaceae bacterium]
MSKKNVSRKEFLKTGMLSTLALGAPLAGRGLHRPAGPSLPGDAKSVIFLVSDGMSSGTLALADLVKQQKFGQASNWMQLYASDRKFHRGLMDMASLDSVVTGSASAASSWGCGRRIENGRVNWGPDGEQYKPVCQIFRDAGKATGLVTSTRITHATPAGFAANVPSREMEDEIAQQYADREYDLLLGGGLRHFEGHSREDGTDLLSQFSRKGYTIAQTREVLERAPADERLLGLFHDSHLPYVVDHATDAGLQRTTPTLVEMAEQALNRLDRNENGFLLQVEGGRVDHAAHANDPAGLVYDQIAFDEVIRSVLDFTEGRDDVLVLLTTDHGNANPGLSGLGDGYRDSPGMLETLHHYRHSFEWIYEQLGYHWSMVTLDTITVSRIRELVHEATQTAISRSEAEMVAQAFRGEFRAPFHDRQWPGAVLAGVLANYNGIYFVGTNHTADFVELAAWGPGSERIPSFVRNTELFELMVDMAAVREFAG